LICRTPIRLMSFFHLTTELMDGEKSVIDGKRGVDRRSMQRLFRLSERINWDCFCDEMEHALPELKSFLDTWGQHCGAPYMVFRGQLCKTILEIWKANDKSSRDEA